tara:strand:- start:380 stop:673 length:294 start_codon:yes stop_codon:yes gene_type:complete
MSTSSHKIAIKLYYDQESGEIGKIVESDQFKVENTLMRADVLQDMIFALQDRYLTAYEAMNDELKKVRDKHDNMLVGYDDYEKIKEKHDQQETEKTT